MSSANYVLDLDGRTLDAAILEQIYGRPIQVRVAPQVLSRVSRSREHVERALKSGRPLYGINTGFAQLCDQRIPPSELDKLQENLVLSHSVGVGEPVPDEIVRLMLLFKIHALSLGYSGIRPDVLKALAELLNRDLLPVVPCKGSLGASGDLAPLAHMSLSLIGRGTLRQDGKSVPAVELLRKNNIEPLRLAAKEGLALINGTQFMTAYGAALCVRAWRACRAADVLTAMTIEAIHGHLSPFDERLHAARPHPGAIAVAKNIRSLLADRPKRDIQQDRRVQDPYSVRCVPQVHGAVRDAVQHVQDVIFRDINSATDNPLVFDDGDILSGGNFHGEPLALALDYLACASAELASISERRQYLLINDGQYGLPIGLVKNSGIQSGLLIAQYTSASLVAENKVLCHPASVDSIPCAGGQEDHVSMGATSAVKCWQIMENVETVLAIELVTAAQAIDFSRAESIAPAIREAHRVVRQAIPHLDVDRIPSDDFQTARSLMSSDIFQAITRKLPH